MMKNVAWRLKSVQRIAERSCRCVNAAGIRQGGKGWRAQVTVSIGVAISEGQGLSVRRFRSSGRTRAMYRAKGWDRNGQFVIDESPKDSGHSTGIRAQFADRDKQFG